MKWDFHTTRDFFLLLNIQKDVSFRRLWELKGIKEIWTNRLYWKQSSLLSAHQKADLFISRLEGNLLIASMVTWNMENQLWKILVLEKNNLTFPFTNKSKIISLFFQCLFRGGSLWLFCPCLPISYIYRRPQYGEVVLPPRRQKLVLDEAKKLTLIVCEVKMYT